MSTYSELLEQRAELDQKIQAARTAEVSGAIATVRQLVSDYDLTPSDCGFKASGKDLPPAPVTKPPVAAKFRGPTGQTWSGRGKAPNWLTALETEGRHRDEFRI